MIRFKLPPYSCCCCSPVNRNSLYSHAISHVSYSKRLFPSRYSNLSTSAEHESFHFLWYSFFLWIVFPLQVFLCHQKRNISRLKSHWQNKTAPPVEILSSERQNPAGRTHFRVGAQIGVFDLLTGKCQRACLQERPGLQIRKMDHTANRSEEVWSLKSNCY